jgi:alkanesulfonate monooxygenase SsuD/methylene tetrahydromethanopterin reductase-like flavin-dependent oxidoreductase (luciferase family)
MKLGLHPMNFSWPGGPAAIEPVLAGVLERAEDAGIHSIWPMDHFFQIPAAGQGPDAPMLEGWATIAWAAGRTRSLQLGTLVTGVHYRHPGLLAKFATTLDVLSGGRAWLGIGAGWNEEESRGLGVPFRPWPSGSSRPSSSAVRASRRRSGWSPGTPTPATSSRWLTCGTSSACSAGTARTPGATTTRS